MSDKPRWDRASSTLPLILGCIGVGVEMGWKMGLAVFTISMGIVVCMLKLVDELKEEIRARRPEQKP